MKGKDKIQEKKILSKLKDLENKILDFLNIKLKVNIKGNEINLDLSNRNISNEELMLLTGVQFDNLEKIDLSHNNISDIRFIKSFKKLKEINLSFNKIKDFSYDSINDIRKDIIKKDHKLIKKNISINLDNNGLIEKDIKEIKNLIISDYENSLNSSKKDNSINALKNKVNTLEKKILDYLNIKLNINLTGKELSIDLNNKNIGNIELNLLSGVEFKNLEEINLSHNELSDIGPLKSFKNLKKIDLSFNKINNINLLKDIAKNNNKIEKINLNNNMINDIQIFKENLFPNIIDINLDNNNLILKDIEEIKKFIQNKNENEKEEISKNDGNEKLSSVTLEYKIKSKNKDIRLFGS